MCFLFCFSLLTVVMVKPVLFDPFPSCNTRVGRDSSKSASSYFENIGMVLVWHGLYNLCHSWLWLGRFEELAAKDAKGALHYLQTAVSAVVDHGHPQQSHQVCSYVA